MDVSGGEYAWTLIAGADETLRTSWRYSGPNARASPGRTSRTAPRSRSCRTPSATANAPRDPPWSWSPVPWPGSQLISQISRSPSRCSRSFQRSDGSSRTRGSQASRSAARSMTVSVRVVAAAPAAGAPVFLAPVFLAPVFIATVSGAVVFVIGSCLSSARWTACRASPGRGAATQAAREPSEVDVRPCPQRGRRVHANKHAANYPLSQPGMSVNTRRGADPMTGRAAPSRPAARTGRGAGSAVGGGRARLPPREGVDVAAAVAQGPAPVGEGDDAVAERPLAELRRHGGRVADLAQQEAGRLPQFQPQIDRAARTRGGAGEELLHERRQMVGEVTGHGPEAPSAQGAVNPPADLPGRRVPALQPPPGDALGRSRVVFTEVVGVHGHFALRSTSEPGPGRAARPVARPSRGLPVFS